MAGVRNFAPRLWFSAASNVIDKFLLLPMQMTVNELRV
ncbi:hypothetical protein SAMN05444169_5053 [Bradyrhizobium erythrophlei]|uniref:Uncharacterized protein n=2 Tax=Bradyrhizobium erythrophlei TaxID=1437360 RepID=A0A1M5P6B4_9BRAD|nr:hypothetical protein SAMN05444169_5053 [Bradyrhizobium erythrophlei]